MRSYLATLIQRALHRSRGRLPVAVDSQPRPTLLPCAAAPVSGSGHTLVVGAGLAGLLVAYRLRQAGLVVDVIEARDRIGGRILTQTNALGTGLAAELGGETFDSNHAVCLSLAAELGLTVVDLQQHQAASLSSTYWFGQQCLSEAELVQELAGLSLDADLAAVKAFLSDGQLTPPVAALDHQSIPEYLAHRGASPRLQAVAETAFTIKYGMRAEEQSSLNFLAFWQPTPDRFHLFGSSDERYYIQGGNAQLSQQLAAEVDSSIQLGTVLESLRLSAAGRYQVSLRQDSGSCDRTYDRVVLTVPFNLLRHVSLEVPLPPTQRQAIASLGYNSPVKIITAHRTRPWQLQGASGLVYSDCPWQHTWEASDSLGGTGAALLVQYPGGHRRGDLLSPPTYPAASNAIGDLERLFPGLKASQLPGELRSPWLEDPFSQSAYSCYRVGQWTAFHGLEGRPAGNLYFAGEHCSRRHQGYMEGAAETAEAVALAILKSLSGAPA